MHFFLSMAGTPLRILIAFAGHVRAQTPQLTHRFGFTTGFAHSAPRMTFPVSRETTPLFP